MLHGRNINGGLFDNEVLFPFGWYTELSDDVKCNILAEAINQ